IRDGGCSATPSTKPPATPSISHSYFLHTPKSRFKNSLFKPTTKTRSMPIMRHAANIVGMSPYVATQYLATTSGTRKVATYFGNGGIVIERFERSTSPIMIE
ncbi:hypothetical protein, partial [Enterovibrio norvegicus]|uniref:hypothetical protein n=1 Tax=Enterovibrio norvegicus TaxID=188144 RepID=UPI0035523FE4